MNKIIPFTKIIKMNDHIDEIIKIALDDTLSLDSSYSIKGDLIVSGSYKSNDEEKEFSYPLPVEIAIDEKYDTSKCTIGIDDFYYELINEEDLRVKIDLILDELFYQEREISKEELVIEDNRQMIDEILPKEENIISNELLDNKEIIESINVNLQEKEQTTIKPKISEKIDDLFKDTSESKDYSIYRVYTVLEGETIEYILDKYSITKDDLASYNDLENIRAGSKLIIPSIDE